MATTSATAQGSLYAMNRSNVTSLSPFIVADNNASLSAGAVLAQNNKVSIYPNPAADVLNVSADNADHLSIFDAMGRKVKETS